MFDIQPHCQFFQLCYFIKWNNNPLICFLLQCKITPSIMLFVKSQCMCLQSKYNFHTVL